MHRMYQFLSQEWLTAVAELRTRLDDVEEPAPVESIEINLEITDAPDAVVDRLHLFHSSVLNAGSLDNPRTTMSLTYDAARALFLDTDVSRMAESFMLGDVDVAGDIAPLIEMQEVAGALTDNQRAFHDGIRALTVA